MKNLTVEYVKIGEIKPYERNAKKHPVEQIEQIKKSIEQFGFKDPIGKWNGEIVEGHGRYLAAKELGLKTVPVIRLDDLTDEQRRAYALAHNKLTMNSDFDIDTLKLELDNIEIDMGDFGFEDIHYSTSDYVEDFFDRGVETKEKPVLLGVKVICGTKEQVDEVMDLLKGAGYNPEEL